MKKFLAIALVVMMGLGFAACTQSPTQIAEKAKTEGANWSVDQWKDAFKQMLVALKPVIEESASFQKKVMENPGDMAKIMQEAEEFQKAHEADMKAMEDLEKAAKATENGKIVADDDEWGKQLAKELGYPEGIF